MSVNYKLEKPENDNYAATIVEIKEVHPLEGCDNVVGTTLFGTQSIISKDVAPGTVGVYFPAESQLSEEYAAYSNLFRNGSRNRDEGVKGYIEDNRRIRTVKFRGHQSQGLFMPLTSLEYIKGLDLNEFSVGDTFDRIGDYAICNKYIIQRSLREQRLEKNKKQPSRVDQRFMPKHYDTDNFFKYTDTIPDSAIVVVTQKLHGTSIRIANTYVNRFPRFIDRVAARLGVSIQRHEMAYVYGSKNVIKDPNNPNQQHYYDEDIYTEEGRKLEGILPENYIIYGELVGWTKAGSPIQAHYTYGEPKGNCQLYVYRVAVVNGQGRVVDLTWDQVVEFCHELNLKYVPELWRGMYGELKNNVTEWFIDKRYKEGGHENAVALDEDSPVDEGVCIRVDGLAPYILKAKSPLFYEHETKMLDEEVIDMETEQNA